jgi:hypothetical protein
MMPARRWLKEVTRPLSFLLDRNIPPAWVRGLAALWLLGCLGVLARFAAGTIAVARLARRSDRVADGDWLSLTQRIAGALGIARPLTLLRGERFGIPVTWGIIYPVVLLPRSADEWHEERRRFVLLHEMAHVRRLDALTQLIAQFAIAIFWFNPLVWLAARRMRVEREHACDDYVLRQGTAPSRYAAELLDLVRSFGTAPAGTARPAFAALAMARPAELEGRMEAILSAGKNRRALGRGRALATACAALLLIVPLAALSPFARQRFEPAEVAMPYTPAIAGFGSGAGAGEGSGWDAGYGLNTDELRELSKTLDSASSLYGRLTVSLLQDSAIYLKLGEKLALVVNGLVVNPQRAASLTPASAVATTVEAPVPAPPPVAFDATPATPSATPSAAAPEAAPCSSIRRNGSSSTSNSHHEDDDPAHAEYLFTRSGEGRCLHFALIGDLAVSPDEREIEALSPDGKVYIRDHVSDFDRELTVTSRRGGRLSYDYAQNGERAEYSEGARDWLSRVLPELLRETGINARERVARLRRAGGIDAVLAEIARTQSTSARRIQYSALLDMGGISDRDAEQIVRQAGRDLASSDGELSAVLAKVPKSARLSGRASEAVRSAIQQMSSDGEKRSVIQQYALSGDREMSLMAMKEARQISSDGEKAELLKSVAPRYVRTPGLRESFFATASTIGSDGELAGVLKASIPHARTNGDAAMSVIRTSKQMSSDGEKADVLIEVVNQRLLTSKQLRDAFMESARSIGSDGEYRRVLEAVLKRE